MVRAERTLEGLAILVTRPQHQSDGLCRLIESCGGRPFRFPTMEILPARNLAQAGNVLHNLDDCRWLFFLSANAVHFAQKAYNGPLHIPRSVRIAAIGRATAKALAHAGIRVDLQPEQGFTSEILLAMPELTDVAEARCVVVRGEGGRDLIGRTLAARGGRVEFAEVYRRALPNADATHLRLGLRRGEIDVVTVTSLESLLNLLVLVGEADESLMKRIPLVVVSGRIEKEALERGFARVAVADNPADEDIVRAIEALDIRGKSVARAD